MTENNLDPLKAMLADRAFAPFAYPADGGTEYEESVTVGGQDYMIRPSRVDERTLQVRVAEMGPHAKYHGPRYLTITVEEGLVN